MFRLCHACVTLFLVADMHLYTLVRWSVHPSVGLSVLRSVCHIFELRAVFTLLLLPNHPGLPSFKFGNFLGIFKKEGQEEGRKK